MGFIYRYTDLNDEIIKYVGIIWAENRSLQQRINEHLKKDSWCWNVPYKVEYIEGNFSRTDAEYIEAHYISLYETYKYYNRTKSNWGISNYIPYKEDKWKYYDVVNFHILNEKCNKLEEEVKELTNHECFHREILNFMKHQQEQIQLYKQMCHIST